MGGHLGQGLDSGKPLPTMPAMQPHRYPHVRAHVFLPEAMMAQIRAEAERRGTNISEVLRGLVQAWMDGEGKKT